MAKVSKLTVIIIAMVVCLLLFYLTDPPLQQNLGNLYTFTSRGSHYWNMFKLPPFPERFYLLWPSSHIEHAVVHRAYKLIIISCRSSPLEKGGQGLPNEANIAEEREKSKVIEAAEESLEKTKTMMEDSAKTVAEMVGEAVHKTADIVKETFSKPTLASQHQDEF